MIASDRFACGPRHLSLVRAVLAFPVPGVFECVVDDLDHVRDGLTWCVSRDDLSLALLAPRPATRSRCCDLTSCTQVGATGDDEFEAPLSEWSEHEGVNVYEPSLLELDDTNHSELLIEHPIEFLHRYRKEASRIRVEIRGGCVIVGIRVDWRPNH